MQDNIKKRDNMKELHKKKDNELEQLYNAYNLIISNSRGHVWIGAPLAEGQHKNLVNAKKMRARVLTVMNQRRHERQFRNGIHAYPASRGIEKEKR